ncbi:HD domain-containing protein [Paenibacillus sp. GYB003]|uniref:HD domain-containing protein n=1 Tax=Paenibacillus sp. GYB003 TaxID=2994392 RepID=UPI002F96830A
MIVQDPIHGDIRIDDGDLLDLAHTSAFRRLAGLKQQGHTHFLLPGATHDRYRHSLGVYANMRRMIEHLQAERGIRFPPGEIKIALVSALLHDIGHGPFSHCFETVTGVHHERWTMRIIAEHDEVSGILARTPGLSDGVLSVIGRRGDFPLLQDMLFSPIGADALDYNSRDLHHSGIAERPLALGAVIGAMDVRETKLVLRPEAVPQIERLVRIRRALFEQGFQHPDVIGKDVLLKLLFKRAGHLFRAGELPVAPGPLLPLFDGTAWPVRDYVRLNDRFVADVATQWSEHADPVLSSLGRIYGAPLASSISWRELGDAEPSPETDDASCTSEAVVQQIKYACYASGITVVTGPRSAVDVAELSPLIREHSHSRYAAKRFFFYLE